MKKAIDAFLRPEDMPHITRQEFCDNMDEILDRVSRENMGFAISEEGKHDLLLCPFDWFDIDCFAEPDVALRERLLTLVQKYTSAVEEIDRVITDNLHYIDTFMLEHLRDRFRDSLNAEHPVSAGQRLYAEILKVLRQRELAE